MNTSQIKQLVDGVKLNAENPALVLENVDTIIKNIKDVMLYLGTDCYDYITQYDNYQYEHVKDASLLKEKLKDTINKVVNNEIQ